MSVSERKAVLESWVAAAAGKSLGIIAHVGAEALTDAKELAAHAAKCGAVAIGVMPTSFFKPDGLDGVLSYLEIIANCAP
jgi:dihydrodipicolinate synthase/N-acetylneuraminate lyase